MEFFMTVLGIVLIVEGVPWFLSPRGMKSVLRQLFTVPEHHLRLLGFFLMILGLLAVFLGRS
jgi:uncharacterized protein